MLLFVAHRDEILIQAEKSFKSVKDDIKTGFFNGERKDVDYDILFASVQSLGKEEYLSESYFPSYVDELALFISENCPEVKGFNRRGLYRMKQFYETYKNNEFVSPLVTQISWTNHLLILSNTKAHGMLYHMPKTFSLVLSYPFASRFQMGFAVTSERPIRSPK